MTAVGYATLDLIPSAAGFGKAVTAQIGPEMATAGAAASMGFSSAAAKGLESFQDFGKKAALGILAVGVASAKLASDFQETTTQLVTGGGESEEALAKVRDGLLKMAPAVGMGPEALAKAMFLVESAGYHGADGLKVMQAAAEGAKVGGADATVVANALTTVMKDYKAPTADAAKITSELVATVASGKTNMADLAGAMSAVAPSAAAAGVGLDQMLGAMGTMTGEGISAQQAAQDLASTISSLGNPTQTQTKAMAQMGLSSVDVAQNLGKKGLTGTMSDLAQAVMQHMGPAGLVLESSFNQSKLAAASAQQMLSQLPPSLQKLGQGYLDGTVTQKEWQAEMKGQPALVASLAKQFATTAKEAHGFSDSLKSGQGDAKTFNALMADMTGGTTGLQTALALTGSHAKDFAANTKTIGSASAEAGGHVKGWGETQKDLATQLAKFSAGIQSLTITLGTALLPTLTDAAKAGAGLTEFFMRGSAGAQAIGVAVGVLAGGALLVWGTNLTVAAVKSTINFASMVADSAKWAARTAVSVSETIALWAMYAAEWIAKTAVASATFLASNAATMASWVATNARQLPSAIATWVKYNAMMLAENARGMASMIAANAKTLASWVAGTAASIAKSVALWVANSAKTIATITVQSAAFVAQKAVILGGAVAMGIATAAQWAWNVAMDANPIGLIIIAITALVGALVWFFTQTTLGKTIWQDVCSFFQTAFQATVDFLTAAWNGLVSFITGVVNLIVLGVKVEWALLQTYIVQPIETAIAWLVGAWNNVVSFFQTVIGNIGRVISDGFNNVVNFFTSLPGRILGALGNVGSWLLEVGHNIIQGLINGITAAAKNIAGAIMGPIQGAINGVKSFLGIHSPSRLMMEIGSYTAQGMALGLQSGAEGVQKASDALVPKLPDVTAPAIANGGVVGALAAGGADSGLTLNYTQNGGQGLTGEQELRRAAQRLKTKLRR